MTTTLWDTSAVNYSDHGDRRARMNKSCNNNTIMDYMSGWCKSSVRLDGKTTIVTGANSGIGKETALDFYKRGSRVIMACRNIKYAEDAKTDIKKQSLHVNEPVGTLLVQKLDLACMQSIRKFAEYINDNESKVHVLVNNAGVMMCPQGKTADEFETQMGTNHLGHALLTLLLLPRLISSAPSRIVCVSSRVHQCFPVDLDDMHFKKKLYNAFESYCRSKSANILFARELSRRLKEHNIEGVTTYSLHPGIVHTELGRHFDDTYLYGATWIWRNILSWFLKSPRCGAQTSIYCAIDDEVAEQSGLYYSDCAVKESSKETQSDENARRLWDITIQLTGLEDYKPFDAIDMGVIV